MFNHAPVGYDCPFCRLVLGLDTPASSQDDIVYRDDDVLAFVPSSRWPNNPGHVIVIPTAHYENIYDLPAELATPIQRVAQAVAIGFKETYGCHGVSTRQHNEPAGQQDVWHYHLHVFPRYHGDDRYRLPRGSSTPHERRPYVAKLRGFLTGRGGAWQQAVRGGESYDGGLGSPLTRTDRPELPSLDKEAGPGQED